MYERGVRSVGLSTGFSGLGRGLAMLAIHSGRAVILPYIFNCNATIGVISSPLDKEARACCNEIITSSLKLEHKS